MESLFLSVLTSLFWVGLLGTVLHFMRRKGIDNKENSFSLWRILYISFFLRILFSFDPGIGKAVFAPRLLNTCYYILCIHNFSILQIKFSVIHLIAAGAGFVALIKTSWFLKKYFQVKHILQDSQPLTQTERTVFERVKKKFPKNRTVMLCKNAVLKTPVSMGIFRKVLCLPENSFTEKELENIYLHEMYHFKNCDHLCHLTAKIAECMFWWFPPVKILSCDFEEFIELRCDACVAGNMDMEDKEAYLRTMVQILKKEENRPKNMSGAILEFAVVSSNKNVLAERFQNVVECKQKQGKMTLPRLVLIGLYVFFYVFSYRFILSPAYQPDPQEITMDAPEAVEVMPGDGVVYYTTTGDIFWLTEQGFSRLDEESARTYIEQGYPVQWEE